MTDFPNGRHTLWLVHKLIDEGSLDPSSEGPSVPEKKILAAVLSSETEAWEAFEKLNEDPERASLWHCFPQEITVWFVDGQVVYDVEKDAIPQELVTDTADEAVALHVQVLISQETMSLSAHGNAPTDVVDFDLDIPITSPNVPLQASEIAIAQDYGDALVMEQHFPSR